MDQTISCETCSRYRTDSCPNSAECFSTPHKPYYIPSDYFCEAVNNISKKQPKTPTYKIGYFIGGALNLCIISCIIAICIRFIIWLF